MISILIPVFNFDVTELAVELSNQLENLYSDGEIIILDDGSEPSFRNRHSQLSSVPHIQYLESATNNGRVRIRQKLAAAAAFEWLLFLDCDSKIVSDKFLETFSKRINDSARVITGGRIYTNIPPADCRFRLHWKYGTSREKSSYDRKKCNNRFMTNNFMIRKEIFSSLDFTNEWEGYGYEDTWMAIQLESLDIPILFIDNPVKHDGIETSELFMSKSREALQNLYRLTCFVPRDRLKKQVRLYNHFYRIRLLGMTWLIQLMYGILRSAIRKNLHSCNPSLAAFDFYRLYYFSTIVKKEKQKSP